jgi:3-oxoadipate enol-lactonase
MVPTNECSMDRLGRDVIEMLDALSIQTVSFCGLSKGGMVGHWLGVRAPERLSRLVLTNTLPTLRLGCVQRHDRNRRHVAIADTMVEQWFTECPLDFIGLAHSKHNSILSPVQPYKANGVILF